jgi:membrane-bound metal-dependent hydrolase YbcI (DUF457 family)
MFIGPFAAGFAAKRLAPRVSLGTLFAAVQLQDLLWPVLLLLGIEHVRIDPGNTAVTPLDFYDYPVTHSFAGAAVIALGFGVVHWLARRDIRAALVLSAAAFSHWLLDFATHRPDLPLTYGGSAKVGLGLWDSVAWTVVVETAMFALGFAAYLKATTPAGWPGRYGLAGLALLLLAIYAANILGPPPPGVDAIAVAGNAMWLFVLAGWWVDRSRSPRVRIPADRENPGGDAA